MATYTREQLVKSVLGELCQVDPNEDVDAADYETVNIACQSMLEELYEDGKIPFDVDGDIPARTGMGSSSAFTVGLLKSLHALKGEVIGNLELGLEAIEQGRSP